MLLVTCSADVKLHECNNFELIKTYRPASAYAYIRSISWCKDGSWLVLVPNEGNPEIIHTKNEVRLLHTILGVAGPVTAVFQRTTKKHVAVSTLSGSIILYDIKSRNIKKKFTNSGATANLLDWNSNDTHLAAGGTNGKIILYSNTTNQKTSTISIPESKTVSALRFHSTQRSLLGSASDEGALLVWDINANRRKFYVKSHQAPITGLAFSPQNRHLLMSVALDRTCRCFDMNTGENVLTVPTDHPLSAVDMASDGRTLAVGTTRGTIYIYDLRAHSTPLKSIVAHAGEIKRMYYQPVGAEQGDSGIIPERAPTISETATPPCTTSDISLTSSILEFKPNIVITDKDNKSKIYEESELKDSFLAAFDSCGEIRSSVSTPDRGTSDMASSEISPQGNLKEQLQKSPHFTEPEVFVEKCSGIKSSLKLKTSSPAPNENRVSFLKQHLLKADISPVLSGASEPHFNADEIRQSIKDTLTDGVKDVVTQAKRDVVIDTMKDVVKETVTNIVKDTDNQLRRDLNRNFLQLKWILSTIFINTKLILEKNNPPSREQMNSELHRQLKQLQQENQFLKQKINELFQNNAQ